MKNAHGRVTLEHLANAVDTLNSALALTSNLAVGVSFDTGERCYILDVPRSEYLHGVPIGRSKREAVELLTTVAGLLLELVDMP